MVQNRKSKYVAVVPTIDTAIYASGDRIGSIMKITDAVDATSDASVLKTLTIVDSASQSSAIDLLFFNDLPTVASADNAALSITDAEMVAKCIGRIVIAAADYTALAANSVAVRNSIDEMMIPVGGSRDIYCVIQSRGTPTYTAATDLTVKFLFEQY